MDGGGGNGREDCVAWYIFCYPTSDVAMLVIIIVRDRGGRRMYFSYVGYFRSSGCPR